MAAKSFVWCLVLVTFFGHSLGFPETGEPVVPSAAYVVQWRSEVRAAVDGAATTLQNNLITTLNGLANSGLRHGTNITGAVATLTRAIITNTFDLAGVVGYMPKLLAQDLPTQFVEVLKLIRRNEVRIPTDVNSSIDNVLAFVRQSQASGISENIFGPITRFLPNLLTGTSDFLVTIFDNLFSLLAGDPGTRKVLLRL